MCTLYLLRHLILVSACQNQQNNMRVQLELKLALVSTQIAVFVFIQWVDLLSDFGLFMLRPDWSDAHTDLNHHTHQFPLILP